jgi:putative hydrolase of the HAD superfamily
LPLYGFGIKAFTLSMIESALDLTNHQLNGQVVEKIIQIGKDLLQKPVELLPEVETVLQALKPKYKLVVATNYFHHIEVMSDKKEVDYQKMLGRLDCKPEDFIMIGNSLKSDVLPVLNIGGTGIHIPYHTTWEYEKIDFEIVHDNFKSIHAITEILDFL